MVGWGSAECWLRGGRTGQWLEAWWASLLPGTWGFLSLKSLGVCPQQILTHRVNCQLQSSVHLSSGHGKLEEMLFPNFIGLRLERCFCPVKSSESKCVWNHFPWKWNQIFRFKIMWKIHNMSGYTQVSFDVFLHSLQLMFFRNYLRPFRVIVDF